MRTPQMGSFPREGPDFKSRDPRFADGGRPKSLARASSVDIADRSPFPRQIDHAALFSCPNTSGRS
jgi:hypothetical protein